ncbi:MAG: DNA translocase FtsK [Pirellulales bacterium]
MELKPDLSGPAASLVSPNTSRGKASEQKPEAAAATATAAPAATAKGSDSLLASVAAAAGGLLAGKTKNGKDKEAAKGSTKAELKSDVSEFDIDELDDEVAEDEASEEEELTAESDSEEAATVDEEEGGPRVRRKKKGAAEKSERDSLEHLDDTSLPEGTEEYVLPGLDLLIESDDINFEDQAVEVRRKAKILEKTFSDFGFNVRVVEIETGPVIAQYEVELEAGLRLSKITSLADDLAIALRVPSVRIVAPIPGKNTVGIEVPNETRQIVRLREVIEEGAAGSKKAKIPLFLGKDVSGNALIADLASLPHLLIAGRTGTGKSVCLNAIIASILMTKRPDEVRMLMIDPKMVELSGYARLPHLMHPVVTDMRKAEAILAWAVDKMEERYALLARAGVRHLVNYNQLGREELMERLKPESSEEEAAIPDHLPFIVIVADEMADLMMTAGKEVEQHIIRLAQKSRAVGIHLILATQKPTVDVITGLIKSNLPARIAFQVASRTDSRVVLDEMGADKLLGNGDMLFLWPGTSTLLRGQGTYLSDDEINRVVDHCSTGEQNFVNELVNLKIKAEGDEEEGGKLTSLKKRDDLYEAAVDVVVREGRGSVSLLQRTLGIGYGRAARLIDFMAEDGIVGNYNGSQAREVVISIADWEAMQAGGSPTDSSESKGGGKSDPPARKNRIRRDEGWDDEDASPQPHAKEMAHTLKIERGGAVRQAAEADAADGEAEEDLWSASKESEEEDFESYEGDFDDSEGEE